MTSPRSARCASPCGRPLPRPRPAAGRPSSAGAQVPRPETKTRSATMTDQYTSPYAGAASTTNDTGQDSPTSTTEPARDEATSLKDAAVESGQQLLDDAKSEAGSVTDEAKRQVGDLWSQARAGLADQTGAQQGRIASGLTSLGEQLDQMAASATEAGPGADVVRDLGARIGRVGHWLESRRPEDVLDEVVAFARRRPGTFLLASATAGVLLGRLTRGLRDAPPAESSAPGARPAHALDTDPVAERPRDGEDLATPIPSTVGWDQT